MEELVLGLHLLIVLFFIFGFAAGLYYNHTGFRYFHAGTLALVTLLMIFGIPCPLTTLEEFLGETDYGGSFIAAWLRRLVYLEWFKAEDVLAADVAFAFLVFSSFLWLPLRGNKKNK
ncbi:MAG: hypothetical protein COV67_01230 [Nitrospinae bacterium CG11_big_fil_rev_8_21_14_0_20_56_8]|nr:MAG: hypothetical protein COV67_01230 [Nitrospinae bacterium CG11_big_fil_rev_8_21_14_0_20_56_8]